MGKKEARGWQDPIIRNVSPPGGAQGGNDTQSWVSPSKPPNKGRGHAQTSGP